MLVTLEVFKDQTSVRTHVVGELLNAVHLFTKVTG